MTLRKRRVVDPGGNDPFARNSELASVICKLPGLVHIVTWHKIMPGDPQKRAGWVIEYEDPNG